MRRWFAILPGIAVFLTAIAGCQSSSTNLAPVVTSEDSELDFGGSDIEPDICGEETQFAELLTLKVVSVDHGELIQNGVNGPLNPAILDIGLSYGSSPTEPPTRLHIDFVTKAPRWIVGQDPGQYPVFLNLILANLSASQEFSTNYVNNEPVYDFSGTWIGNRVASWDDPLAMFDGLVPLNETFILTSCHGILRNSHNQSDTEAQSTALYIQARLTGTY